MKKRLNPAQVFAPPLPTDRLPTYRALAARLPGPAGDLMRKLLSEVILKGMELLREDEAQACLRLFDQLPAGPTKDACFHLLWFAQERMHGRKPVTNDQV